MKLSDLMDNRFVEGCAAAGHACVQDAYDSHKINCYECEIAVAFSMIMNVCALELSFNGCATEEDVRRHVPLMLVDLFQAYAKDGEAFDIKAAMEPQVAAVFQHRMFGVEPAPTLHEVGRAG